MCRDRDMICGEEQGRLARDVSVRGGGGRSPVEERGLSTRMPPAPLADVLAPREYERRERAHTPTKLDDRAIAGKLLEVCEDFVPPRCADEPLHESNHDGFRTPRGEHEHSRTKRSESLCIARSEQDSAWSTHDGRAARAEQERRSERCARARRPPAQRRRARRPRAPLALDCDQNGGSSKENKPSRASSPADCSPARPPPLDLRALHRQLGREEPARSVQWPPHVPTPLREASCVGEAPLLRPGARLTGGAGGGVNDTDSPESAHATMLPPSRYLEEEDDIQAIMDGAQEKRLEKIFRKIHSLKRKLWECGGAEVGAGAGVGAGRLQTELRRLQECRRGLRALTEAHARDVALERALRSDKPMDELVVDIEEWVSWEASRGAPLATQKVALQRALLRLEAARGRPPHLSAERGAARPLYERYRHVKRQLAAAQRSTQGGVSNGGVELATILEHEALLVTATSLESSSDNQSEPASDKDKEAQLNNNDCDFQSIRTDSIEEAASSTSSARSDELPPHPSSLRSNESLHCLPLDELHKLLAETKTQKSSIRKVIKEYEAKFETENCRKFQKDDRKNMEEEYIKYKAVKARIKLLTALMNKHSKSKVN